MQVPVVRIWCPSGGTPQLMLIFEAVALGLLLVPVVGVLSTATLRRRATGNVEQPRLFARDHATVIWEDLGGVRVEV